jgi:hypothetical protein
MTQQVDWRDKLREYVKKGYQFEIDVDDDDEKINSNTVVTGFCVCGEEIRKTVKDLLRRGCKSCNLIALKTVPTDYSVCPNDVEDEKWVAITGGFVSNKARACNAFGKLCTPNSKHRWFLYNETLGEPASQYASIVVAKAFKIENYEKLCGAKCSYVVMHKDGDSGNYNLDNLVVGTRADIGAINGKKSHKSERFAAMMSQDLVEKLKTVKFETIDELPDHLIFEDGNIYNGKNCIGGKRFCAFSNSGQTGNNQYYQLCTNEKDYFVHRLICIAFQPIEGKKTYDDYKDLVVNHIDGNTTNNQSSNLEWVTASENMNHAYTTSLNKKVQGVLQYKKKSDGTQGDFIAEFKSIAQASRDTKIAEHEIRSSANGKGRSQSGYLWCFKDPKKAEEWSKKFASK